MLYRLAVLSVVLGTSGGGDSQNSSAAQQSSSSKLTGSSVNAQKQADQSSVNAQKQADQSSNLTGDQNLTGGGVDSSDVNPANLTGDQNLTGGGVDSSDVNPAGGNLTDVDDNTVVVVSSEEAEVDDEICEEVELIDVDTSRQTTILEMTFSEADDKTQDFKNKVKCAPGWKVKNDIVLQCNSECSAWQWKETKQTEWKTKDDQGYAEICEPKSCDALNGNLKIAAGVFETTVSDFCADGYELSASGASVSQAKCDEDASDKSMKWTFIDAFGQDVAADEVCKRKCDALKGNLKIAAGFFEEVVTKDNVSCKTGFELSALFSEAKCVVDSDSDKMKWRLMSKQETDALLTIETVLAADEVCTATDVFKKKVEKKLPELDGELVITTNEDGETLYKATTKQEIELKGKIVQNDEDGDITIIPTYATCPKFKVDGGDIVLNKGSFGEKKDQDLSELIHCQTEKPDVRHINKKIESVTCDTTTGKWTMVKKGLDVEFKKDAKHICEKEGCNSRLLRA